MQESPFTFALGFIAQALFSARMLVQWLLSEKAKKVVSPAAFWYLSLLASLLFLVYGWLREDFALIAGQFTGYCVYIWNLWSIGAFDRLPRPAKRAAVILLALIPVSGAAALVFQDPGLPAKLFSNENIPHGLLAFGLAGPVVFSFRFLYQFLYSARRGSSSLPAGFWLISLIGSLLVITYGILRRDPVVILAQAFGLFTYIRNLMLWNKERRSAS